MPETAKLIEVRRNGPAANVFLDGVELPALIAEAPIEVTVDPNGIGRVRLTLMASQVTVEDIAAVAPQQPVEPGLQPRSKFKDGSGPWRST